MPRSTKNKSDGQRKDEDRKATPPKGKSSQDKGAEKLPERSPKTGSDSKHGAQASATAGASLSERVDMTGEGINVAQDLFSGDNAEIANPEGGHPNVEEGARSQEKLTDIAYNMCVARLEATASGVPTFIEVGDRSFMTRWKKLGIATKEEFKTASEGLVNRVTQMTAEEQVELMRRLWNQEYRDCQYLVIAILTEATIPLSRNLGFEKLFELIRELIITRSGTDTVDELAKCHLNALAYLEPPETWPVMDKWIEEDDQPWLQRAALLHQFSMGSYCSSDRLFKYCERFFKMDRETRGFDLKLEAMEKALDKYADTGDREKTDKDGKDDKDDKDDKDTNSSGNAIMEVVNFIEKHKKKMSLAVSTKLMELKKALEDKRKKNLQARLKQKSGRK